MADDRDRDSDRETRRTTIVTTDGDGRGSAAIILLVVVVAILLAVLFFGGVFDRDDEDQLNVELNTPDVNVNLPESTLPPPPPIIVAPDTQAPPPDVNVNITTQPAEENLDNAVSNSG